ncbi:MAG: hypothetical protein U0T83_04705 [Bacteriovoracaceae bacterium]
MIKYPKLYLPQDFVGLLKVNVAEKSENWRKIIEYVWSHPTLYYIVQNCFQGLDQKKPVDYIINTLGWKNFRDRLGAIFLYHFKYGMYPNQATLTNMDDVLKLNAIIENYAFIGSSRGYMFGLYLKFVQVMIEKNEMILNPNDLKLNSDIINLLKLMNRKVERIDWLLIIIWHMVGFLGLEPVKNELTGNSLDYKKFLKKIKPEEREFFIQNCLMYGQAIHEPEIFTNLL